MLYQEQAQSLFLSQQMLRSLSILQMNKLSLTIALDQARSTNPLIKTSNLYNPWNSKSTSQNDLLEDIIKHEQSLFEQLREDLILEITQDDYPLIYLLIGNINAQGYLQIPCKDLIQGTQISLEQLQSLQKKIQHSSFIGLCSESQEEYLEIIINKKFTQNSLEWKIFQHLKNKRSKVKVELLARIFHSNKAQVQESLDHLQSIPMHPLGSKARYIYPDFIIKIENEQLKIQPTAYLTPKIEITSNSTLDKKELARYRKEAEALQKALSKRELSLQKHAEALLSIRYDFFFPDVEAPQNLGLKELAEMTNFHMSTISRALKNRYFLFEGEIYSFAELYTHKVGTSNQYQIKKQIQQIIQHEDPDNPLSDSAITRILERKGIKVARRTVNKYRHELKITSLYQR